MRVGLAGCGGIARQYHLRILRAHPGVELVAIADPSERALAQLTPLPGEELLNDSFALVARDDIDALVVCAATPAHAEIAAAVSGGGQHLYLEKPIALDARTAGSLERSLAGRRAITAVGFSHRFSPAFAELRSRIRRGEVGAPSRIRGWHCEVADTTRISPWKLSRETGGGVLLDLASHQVDFARWLLGAEVEEVEEASVTSHRSEQDDARIAIRMSDGTVVETFVSYVQGRKHRWEVEGASGVLRAERWPARVRRRRHPSPGGPSRLSVALRSTPFPQREPSFRSALDAFIAAANGADVQLPTISDGRRSLEVVLEAERLALSGS
jgi:predicted dehydrogenase